MDKIAIQKLVEKYSIEITVREASRVARFCDLVPPGTRVYIAHVPSAQPADTSALAERLRKEGMEPVPHIVARRIDSIKMLNDFLRELSSRAAVRQALLVAGDIAAPVGELASSLQILTSGLLEKYGITTIGVAGHPEGHREVPEGILRDALRSKSAYAQRTGAKVYVVTQFTFSAEAIALWEASFAADIGSLPIIVGLPGLASVKSLIRFATDCGVGASLQAFKRRAASLTKLLSVATPDEIVAGLAHYTEATPNSRITGIHFFPFGSFKQTADWANQIVAGNFDINDDGTFKMATAVVK